MVLALVQAVIALVVAFGINLAPDQIVAAARSAAALTAAAAVFAAASSCAWLKGLGSGAGRMVVTSGAFANIERA